MFGKSARAPISLGILCVVLSCAHNVPQDSATGADGKQKTAKTLTLENGEAKAKGIVTYPGGDRVDWKVIELPDKIRGIVDIKLQWQPPRPGLQLAFDVFDEYNTPVVQSKKTGKKRSSGRVRTATIDNAKGKYFIRVYAVGRGDAGRYKLAVAFTPDRDSAGGIDWTTVPINEPPRLADLPGVVVPCDPVDPDIKNPECRKICWQGAPANWPGCSDTCTANPPDWQIPACARDAPCPAVPNRHFKKCPKSVFGACKDPAHPDPENPNCDDITVPPVPARITDTIVNGKEIDILIMAGKDQGIGDNWTASIVSSSGQWIADIKIISLNKGSTKGRVTMSLTQLQQNKNALFKPPPRRK